MPEWIQINSLEASPHDPASAYVAATMYKWDDFKPYLYKTSDHGKTWKKITNGIPENAFTRVIREDPNKRFALRWDRDRFVHFIRRWCPMASNAFNLPIVPITDLVVHKREQDLVAATQGRSFWIFDDLPLLHQMMDVSKVSVSTTRLFKPEVSYRMQGGGGGPLPAMATVGKNPPNGVVVYYSLAEAYERRRA